MAVSTKAFYLVGGAYADQGLESQAYGPMMTAEPPPAVIYGQGTPAAIPPFTVINKGSLYLCQNQGDDTTAVFQKVDEGGDAADWVKIFADGEALIGSDDIANDSILNADVNSAAAIAYSKLALTGALLNADVNASAAIAYSKLALSGAVLVGDLETNALSNIYTSPVLVDISDADAEYPSGFHAVANLTITEAGLLWVEASADDTGAHEGGVLLGVSSANGDIVNSTLHGDAQAAGSYQALSIADGALVAGETMWISHDQSTGAGTYYVVIKYDLDS